MTRKIGAGITEQYLYDGLDIILMKDGSNKIRTRYFRGLAIDEPWQRIDFGTKRNSPSTNRVYMADALGSIVALTDPNQNITTEYDYEPFGKSIRTGLSTLNSYTFTAREDDATGLYYYRARYYHPALGRFVSEDPLGMVESTLAYVYVRNNPLRFIDPFGLESLEACIRQCEELFALLRKNLEEWRDTENKRLQFSLNPLNAENLAMWCADTNPYNPPFTKGASGWKYSWIGKWTNLEAPWANYFPCSLVTEDRIRERFEQYRERAKQSRENCIANCKKDEKKCSE
jgi:RHS repeat-associated protein